MAFSRFPRLSERRHQVAGTLSGGEQQMLAMARTLSVEPAVLLLDEISMGLAPMIVDELYGLVAQIAAEGVAVILAEQFAATALGRRHRRRGRRAGPDRGGGQARRAARRPGRRLSRRCRRMSPTPPAARDAAPPAALAGTALLLVAGGSGLLAAAFSDGPAGADSPLGGFTVSGLAEAVTAQYEQPNFPLPATPSLEFDEGYASTTDNFGPSGTATASSLYPGQVVANAGPELALLVPGVPLPPAPVWPVQATSEYPQAPNTGSTDQPGVNMDASSTTNGNTASATLGDGAATAGSNGADPTQRRRRARATRWPALPPSSASAACRPPRRRRPPARRHRAGQRHRGGGLILGGFITIGSVTSTATAASDGSTGKVTGSTPVQNMDIAGEQVTVDPNGSCRGGEEHGGRPPDLVDQHAARGTRHLHVDDQCHRHCERPVGQPDPRRAQDHDRPQDAGRPANMLASLLPASLTSQLPVALPNDQQRSLDLATLQASPTA